MSQAHSTTKRRTFKRLKAFQRGQIEAMLRQQKVQKSPVEYHSRRGFSLVGVWRQRISAVIAALLKTAVEIRLAAYQNICTRV
ncbi:hypothetical protein [Selenomonas sputigena]|uniref:hypothetical protein n=1 Tax=Selenomonas sputigena TaxID=69823 RepID=UPI0022316BB6|nr:hypothetical protein [Selenomonas sputigena]UZD42642.1 hypothetical protein OL240_08835 [Selenomonas sputigena]